MAVVSPPVEFRSFSPGHVPRPRLSVLESPLAPFDVEIGCGVGLHPIAYCRQHPSRRLVALEKSPIRFQKFLNTLVGQPPLPNLHLLHVHAISWITHAVRPASVERYFLLYPSPYPKERQRNKRWHFMPFMHHLLSTLREEGEIFLATNQETYAREARNAFTKIWGLELHSYRELTSSNAVAGIPRTHFERKYLKRGEVCFDLRFRKRT